jgi:hypothetical protein
MATLTSKIYENITLNGNDLGAYTTYNIDNINNIDNRILTLVTNSYTTLFSIDPAQYPTTAGTFSTGSFKYARITNKSNNNVILAVSTQDNNGNTYDCEFTISGSSSFMLSTSFATIFPSLGQTQYITDVKIQPLTNNTTVEYYIATA